VRPATTQQAAQSVEDAAQVLIILDASGSMSEPLGDGTSKMAAAKQAIANLVQTLPAGVMVGLRVYAGTGMGSVLSPCSNTRLLVPIRAGGHSAIVPALAGVQPSGPTPISNTLVVATRGDFPLKGKKKNIILVSDGEETCSANPCPVVLDLLRKEPLLHIDVIGFGALNDNTLRQLRCVAASTFGKLKQAQSAKDLRQQLGDFVDAKREIKGRLIKTTVPLNAKTGQPSSSPSPALGDLQGF
jgi:Ca-activated chloride channel family protein